MTLRQFLFVKMCIGVFGSLALVALVACPVVAAADSAAPDGLENKHDYASVDISTLDGWELTYVPEARKKPIFDAILKGVNWRLREDGKQASFCKDVHHRLLAWDGVEIIEPSIRANRYGDPAFKSWREQCPEMDPHKSQIQGHHRGYFYDRGIAYGSSHFKVFGMPRDVLGANQVLFYYMGSEPDDIMDRLGNYLGTGSYAVSGSGNYRVINLRTCEVTSNLRNMPSVSFSYFTPHANKSYAESAVFRIGDDYYVVGSRRSTIPRDSGYLIYYRLSKISTLMAEPDCVFDYNFFEQRQ